MPQPECVEAEAVLPQGLADVAPPVEVAGPEVVVVVLTVAVLTVARGMPSALPTKSLKFYIIHNRKSHNVSVSGTALQRHP